MNVPSPECFVCTESVPPPRKSACLCTDRYVHDACLSKMLEGMRRTECPVCAAPYTNLESQIEVVSVDFFSRGGAVLGAAIICIILLPCAANTWLAYCCGRKLSSQEDFVVCFASIMMTSVGMAAAIFIGRECVVYGPRALARSMMVRKRKVRVMEAHNKAHELPSEILTNL